MSQQVRRRWAPVMVLAVASLVLGAAGVFGVVVHKAQPGRPPAFYTLPSPLPIEPPGTVIRQEVVKGFYAGATTYRVLYQSTSYDGSPTAVSGVIIVPDGSRPNRPRNIVAWAQGTVGVATSCAASLIKGYGQFISGISQFVAAGYVISATDYQGLGTPGPHPYLVGSSEAMNVLDSVRAAHDLEQANAGTDFAVFGESQGGHAALFTGQLAPRYAPDLHLVGVAPTAPASDLVELFKTKIGNTVGNVLIAFTMASWEAVYHDATLEQVLTPVARPLVRKIATYCIHNPRQVLASVPAAIALKLSFLSQPPWTTEPWKAILAANSPGNAPTGAPILITQGDADLIVPPKVQADFVARLCANGQRVDYRILEGVGHVGSSAAAAPQVAMWLADRFAGRPAPSTCGKA